MTPTKLDLYQNTVISHSLKGSWLVAILTGALFATFLSPQLGFLGRGLRSSLPLFFLLIWVVVVLTPRSAWQKLGRYVFPTLLGFAFAIFGLLKNTLEPYQSALQNHVFTIVVCMMVWIGVVILRILFPESLEYVRWIALIVLGASLGMGIPLLIQQPGIARLTAGNPIPEYNDLTLYLSGVANYSWYTPVALAWPSIANWLYHKSHGQVTNIVGWGLLVVASIAVILSTLSMALFLLGLGIVLWFILAAVTSGTRTDRWIAAGVLLALLVALPSLYYLGLNYDATTFSISKLTRLTEGTLTYGIGIGDETGRVDLFTKTMETFFDAPIFGAWGFETRYYFIGGHSSWADTLALYGIVGLILWLGFLSPSWRKRQQPLSISAGVAGGTLSWFLFIIGGILNPTFNSIVGLLLIWLFDEGGIWQTQQAKIVSDFPKASFIGRR